MGTVVADITISLDGYVTAPGVDLEHGLGVGGEDLHVWALDGTDEDRRILDATADATGAVVMGRTLFDIVDGPHGWSGDMGYGAKRDQSAPPPVFVVTHSAPESIRLTDRMHIVTDGLPAALDRAQEAAGDRDVVIMGGGAIIASALRAGLVDVLSLHIAPLALGGGTSLFDGRVDGLELDTCVATANAVHVTYRRTSGAGSGPTGADPA